MIGWGIFFVILIFVSLIRCCVIRRRSRFNNTDTVIIETNSTNAYGNAGFGQPAYNQNQGYSQGYSNNAAYNKNQGFSNNNAVYMGQPVGNQY